MSLTPASDGTPQRTMDPPTSPHAAMPAATDARPGPGLPGMAADVPRSAFSTGSADPSTAPPGPAVIHRTRAPSIPAAYGWGAAPSLSLDTTTSSPSVVQHQVTGPANAAPEAVSTKPRAVPVARMSVPVSGPALVRTATGSSRDLRRLPDTRMRSASARQ